MKITGSGRHWDIQSEDGEWSVHVAHGFYETLYVGLMTLPRHLSNQCGSTQRLILGDVMILDERLI